MNGIRPPVNWGNGVVLEYRDSIAGASGNWWRPARIHIPACEFSNSRTARACPGLPRFARDFEPKLGANHGAHCPPLPELITVESLDSNRRWRHAPCVMVALPDGSRAKTIQRRRRLQSACRTTDTRARFPDPQLISNRLPRPAPTTGTHS